MKLRGDISGCVALGCFAGYLLVWVYLRQLILAGLEFAVWAVAKIMDWGR